MFGSLVLLLHLSVDASGASTSTSGSGSSVVFVLRHVAWLLEVMKESK